MKKFISIFLLAILVLSATSCSNSKNEEAIETLKSQIGEFEDYINQLKETESDETSFEELTIEEIELSETEIAKKCSPAVFYIEKYNADGICIDSGSGFFISEDGLAVTCYHVVKDAATLKVQTKDSDDWANAININYDDDTDIAIIQVEEIVGQKFNYLELGDINSVEQGEKVYAIGNPKGFKNTFSAGNVAYVSRVEYKNFMQHTAPISQGSSGGPLLNRYGKVIGVNKSTWSSAWIKTNPIDVLSPEKVVTPQLLNFASPVSNIERIKNGVLIKQNQAKVTCTVIGEKQPDGTYTIIVTASGGSSSGRYAIGYDTTRNISEYLIPVDGDGNPLNYRKFTDAQPGSTWYFGACKEGDDTYYISDDDVIQYIVPMASYIPPDTVQPTT